MYKCNRQLHIVIILRTITASIICNTATYILDVLRNPGWVAPPAGRKTAFYRLIIFPSRDNSRHRYLFYINELTVSRGFRPVTVNSCLEFLDTPTIQLTIHYKTGLLNNPGHWLHVMKIVQFFSGCTSRGRKLWKELRKIISINAMNGVIYHDKP